MLELGLLGLGLLGLEPDPPTLNDVLTTGHAPLAVHDLKWTVWLPEAMPTPVLSTSNAVTPHLIVELESIE